MAGPTILNIFQLAPSELFFKIFLPFALTLVILFAVLEMTRLFRRKINLMVSLIVTLMVATTPLFARIATLISQYGSYTALIAFIAVFILGVGSWTFRRGREYVSDAIDAERDLKRLYKQRAKLLDQAERTSSDSSRAAKYDELENVDRQIRTRENVVRHHRRL